MEKYITKKLNHTTSSGKIVCEQCKKKISVIIENKKYYCGECALHNLKVKEGAKAFTKSMVYKMKYKN